MIYRAIGLMSGSSLDGLDIVFATFHENGGKWSYEIQNADCLPYPPEWKERLASATSLSARDYQQLHADFGRYCGERVNEFIRLNALDYQVALIGSHGHTSFHHPGGHMTAQLGDGASIAALTRLPVVSDLRSVDVALGGQGAPIVPIGERLLLNEYRYFLNLGGIANISSNSDPYTAFDVCPANRVMDLVCEQVGKPFDDGGQIAAGGSANDELLASLNSLAYYRLPHPKSLANEFGTGEVYPMILKYKLSPADSLRTYVEHLVVQVTASVAALQAGERSMERQRLLITGGGAFNRFLIDRLTSALQPLGIEVVIPDKLLVQYKEALIMALIGILRWREESNAIASVTGASRDSIGGALWMGGGN